MSESVGRLDDRSLSIYDVDDGRVLPHLLQTHCLLIVLYGSELKEVLVGLSR